MKFLIDENLERRLADLLRELGHDVKVVGLNYAPSLADSAILARAVREGRIVVTNDRDFGELIFLRGLAHAGVIYFRINSGDIEVKCSLLAHILDHYADDLNHFFVVSEDRIRIRRG